MNRLPDRQIDVDDPPRLGRIRRSGDGHVETLAARVGCDKAKLPQEFLQVAHKAWFIDDDVQAAEALRSCRNEVAFSHFADEIERVKGTARDRTGNDVTAIPRTGNSWIMERVTAESSVDDLRRQRERVEKWPSGPTRERVLEALDEWIAQKTLSPHALFSQRLTPAGRR
jgi:hypothetical protein